jgi:hypothetical protein
MSKPPRIAVPTNDDELTALEERAAELAGCIEGSREEAELIEIADAIDAYTAKGGFPAGT